jgi:BolA protein
MLEKPKTTGHTLTREDQIRAALVAAFNPRSLDVINESHQHAHHVGHDGSGESHFRVKIASEAFAGMTRVGRHRAVHEALGKDLVGRIHALALEISE